MKKITTLFLALCLLLSLFSCYTEDDSDYNYVEKFYRIYDINGNLASDIEEDVFNIIVKDLTDSKNLKALEDIKIQYSFSDQNIYKLNSNFENSSNFASKVTGVSFSYRGHLHAVGWMPWTSPGFTVERENNYSRIEALQFSSSSYIANFMARGHVQGIGWQEWRGLNSVIGTVG